MKEYISVIQERIEMMAHRIKKSEESPDPTVLRSSRLLDELFKSKMEAHLDAIQRGRPTVETDSQCARLYRVMGIERYDYPELTDDSRRYPEYKAVIERMGFPEKCCERSVGQLAMCELGELPKPDAIIAGSLACDAHKFERRCLGSMFNIPVFFIDAPLNEEDKRDLSSLNYIVEQLGELIEWLEKKLPGVKKYDEDRLIEMQEMDAIGEKYRYEIYQLMKQVPCPVAPLDSYRKRSINFEPSRYPNMQKGIEFLRASRDELGERVASGKGPYPEERLRLLWSGEPIQKDVIHLDAAKLLMERKVAMPFCQYGPIHRMARLRHRPYGEVSEYGVKLSPLQEEARMVDAIGFGGAGKRWVNLALDLSRDIGAHGIIHYQVIGCTPTRAMGSVLADRAEKELGIPTLNIEGRILDPDYMTGEQFEEKLSYFIDKCFDWAGKPRQ